MDKDKSDAICCEDNVGFSVPVMVSDIVGIVPAAFQTSITQFPVWFAIMVQPVIVPEYGIVAYPLFPIVSTEPAPSIVIPNDPDNAPPETVPLPEPVGTTIGKVDPSPFVNVMVLPAIDAVTSRDPVLVVPPPPPLRANDAVKAYEAEVDVVAKEAEVDVVANEADTVNDEVAALEDDIANEDVPCRLPVIPAVTIKDPVTSEFPVERNPFLILNSFAISVHYPRLVIFYKYGIKSNHWIIRWFWLIFN